MDSQELSKLLRQYDGTSLSIATLGTHSALNILKGAKDEGINSIALTVAGRSEPYRRFPVADQIIELEQFSEILDPSLIKELQEQNTILIPHASLIAYVGVDAIEKQLPLPLFGAREIFRKEAEKAGLQDWMTRSGIRIPKTFSADHEFDEEVIVKFTGARGGSGYFLARGSEDMKNKSREMGLNLQDLENAWIQEFIRGVTMFFHYFYDPLLDQNLLVGMDRRYESDVDGLGRIPADVQLDLKRVPTYSVVGNIPVVIRESLLPKVFEIGDKLLQASREITSSGLIGPYCAEAIITPNNEIVVFEISSRIVAGTSVGIGYSPYEYLLSGNTPMYTGRRIARTIKNAAKMGRLKDILT